MLVVAVVDNPSFRRRRESNLRNDYHHAHGAIRRCYLLGDDSMNLAKHATKMLGATLVAFATAGPALADTAALEAVDQAG